MLLHKLGVALMIIVRFSSLESILIFHTLKYIAKLKINMTVAI